MSYVFVFAFGIGLVAGLRSLTAPAAVAWAAQFSNGAALALRAAKEAIDTGLEVDLHTGLEIERQQFAGLFATEDRSIGMKSFVQDGPGKAAFKGR